jgi:hypothetical protein
VLVVFERSPDDTGAAAGPAGVRVAVDEDFASAWSAA